LTISRPIAFCPLVRSAAARCHDAPRATLRAAELLRRGVIPSKIARRVGVPHQVVSERRKQSRQGGRAALRAAGEVGRPRKLSPAQLS